MDRKFSRIENLWPRDGSCPLPLRSKSFPGNCFQIVKTQKISRGSAAHVWESPFAPNEVPAPVCATALTESRYHVRSAHDFKVRFAFAQRSGAMKAPVGLLSDRTVLRKQDGGASPRQVTVKEKYRPRSAAMILSGEVSGKMNRVCCGAVNSFVDFSSRKWWVSR